MVRNSFVFNIMRGIALKLKPKHSPYKKAGLSWLDMKLIKHMPEDDFNKAKLLGKEIHFYGHVGFLDALREIFFDEIYKAPLSDKPFIIDCGANIGLSIIYFKQHYPKAQVLAFEPDSTNFRLLKKNIESFGFNNVELRNEAVWTENTVLNFSNDGTMSSKITNDGSHQVKAIRLADQLNRKIDLLKIDIEGAEYAVLKDVKDKLENVENLFVEYHGTFEHQNELIEILQIMNDKGFSIYFREAAPLYQNPFTLQKPLHVPYDLQLNIFGVRKNS